MQPQLTAAKQSLLNIADNVFNDIKNADVRMTNALRRFDADHWPLINEIYERYYRNCRVAQLPLTIRQQDDFLSKLKSGSTQSWIRRTPKLYRIYGQSQDSVRVKTFAKNRNEFSYRVNKIDSGTDAGKKGRLVTNTLPTCYFNNLKKMKTEAKNGETQGFRTAQSKIAGPARYGSGSEDGLYYITSGDDNTFVTDQNITTLANRVKLADNEMQDFVAPGMHRVSKGVGYAETPVPPVNLTIRYNGRDYVGPDTSFLFSSHGIAHSTMIAVAMRNTFANVNNVAAEQFSDFIASYDLTLAAFGMEAANPAKLTRP